MHPKWKGDLEARQAFNMMKNQRMSSGNQEDMDETLKYCHHVPRKQQTTGLTSLSSASPVNHPMGATCPLDCEVLVCSYHPFSGVPDEKFHDTLGWGCQEFILSAKLSLFPWSHPLRHLMLCVSLSEATSSPPESCPSSGGSEFTSSHSPILISSAHESCTTLPS